MKNKFISFVMIMILSLNPIFVYSANINLDELENNNNTLIYLEDTEIIDNDLETSFYEATENINDITSTNSILFSDLENDIILEQAFSTMSLNVPTVTNYMGFSQTNTTFIDVTDLATGDVVSHDCTKYLGTNFDENNHWEECTICGKQFNVYSHNYTSYWLMSNSCSKSNKLRHTCACGYYYETPNTRSHGAIKTWCAYAQCCFACSVCYDIITDYGDIHYNSSGQQLGCATGRSGTCKNCGLYWGTIHQGACQYYSGNFDENYKNTYFYRDYCYTCGTKICDLDKSSCTVTQNGNYFKFEDVVYYPFIVTKTSNPRFSETGCPGKITNYSVSKNGHYVTFICEGYLDEGYEKRVAHIYINVSGTNFTVETGVLIQPDIENPSITNISENDIVSNNDWIISKELTIQGTENYCKSVKLSMTDEEGNVYLNEVAVNVDNNQWSYTFTPNIESNSEGKKFIITVKDSWNNTTIKDDFILYKVDKKPPTVTTNENTTSTEWNKTKEYTVSCTDLGVGNVNIAFNDLDELESANYENNYFYKNFTFTGDVYGKTTGAVYYVDGLGNTNISFVDIYNLDNTPPTIEEVLLDKTLHSTNVTIQANDMNTKLNAEGSGITGYAITTDNQAPSDYQESNTFTITEPNTYYLWVKDLVGNVTSKEFDIPIQYKVTINPDGGTWKGSTEPQEVILSSDEKYDLSPIPEKEGYTFVEWQVTGEGYVTDDSELVVTGSDVEVVPLWTTNQYSVTYIDFDLTHNQNLNQITKQVNFDTIIRGFDLGKDVSDNTYYNQYRLVSDTESKVTTSNNIVYRYFEFCYTEKSTHIDFNDNDNIDNLRPETYKLQLKLEDGTIIDEVTLSSDIIDYTFEKLPKYDENGTEYKYQIIPIISDRYKVTPNPETGLPEIDYTSPEYSILIPKLTTLNGKTGELSYTLKVNSTLFYDDKIIITPDDSFLLTDGISTLTADIFQSQTIFMKEDIINHQLTINGDIQVNKLYFAGTWTGTFNFNIKYEVKN